MILQNIDYESAFDDLPVQIYTYPVSLQSVLLKKTTSFPAFSC